MSLPTRPPLSDPIPNAAFSYLNESFVKGPYWNMKLGEGLSVDENSSVQISGLPSEPPSALLYGPNGTLGVGAGLTLSGDSLLAAEI
jgi:hypothetical protein